MPLTRSGLVALLVTVQLGAVACGECECRPPNDTLAFEITRPGEMVLKFRGRLDSTEFECDGSTRNFASFSCNGNVVTFPITPERATFFVEALDGGSESLTTVVMPKYRVMEFACCPSERHGSEFIVLMPQ